MSEPVRFGLVALLLGILMVVSSAGPVHAQSEPTGTLSGQILDQSSGAPVGGTSVILTFPAPEDGSDPGRKVVQAGPEGDYDFGDVPAGFYLITFVKSGYQTSTIANFEVVAGRDNVQDFPLQPTQISATGEVMELDEFVYEADVVAEQMENLELRLEADQQLNLLSAEDFSKFAASDVADAMKRVAGVNIVEGQFAVIRGLEDRYSSTLYNGAPIPSPDPDSQSVQLDLFPSDIVANLEVGKTFSASSASNSAAGSIGIITHDYPEEWTFKVSAGTGFNERALDEFQRLDRFNPVGKSVDGDDVIESDFGGLFGGRTEIFGRELRLKFVFANEIDYSTANGKQGESQPTVARLLRFGGVIRGVSGGIALGTLDRQGPVFRRQVSLREEQRTFYGGLGFDLDEAGAHRVDGSILYTKASDEVVELRDQGYVPGLDLSPALANPGDAGDFLRDLTADPTLLTENYFFDWFDPDENRGVTGGQQAFFSPLFESRTFDRDRELRVYQLNGAHELDQWVDGLKATWVANYSEADQDERTFNVRFSLDTVENLALESSGVNAPDNYPASIEDLNGTPIYASRNDTIYSENEIRENLYFGRIDLEYDFEPARNVVATLKGGYWWEQANRDVTSLFEDVPTGDITAPGVLAPGFGIANPATYDPNVPVGSGPRTQEQAFSVVGFTPREMGSRVFRGAGFDRVAAGQEFVGTSKLKREVRAFHGELKLTLFDDVDVLGGLRIEDLRITSQNDPFLGLCGADPLVNGECPAGNTAGPDLFPSRFFFFDRADDVSLGEVAALPEDFTFNDELVGVALPMTPDGLVNCITVECVNSVVNGEIDRLLFLPAVTLNYRPIEGVILRFGYSQTVARPSFRELAYYASQESASDEFIVGNPALETSDVENFDGRVEWTFGDFGDLLAFSGFYKKIEKPIEELFIVDFRNVTRTGVSEIRTFANNPSDADLFGIELEGRKTLDFIGSDSWGGFLETISVGGNFTWIDAEVDRNPIQQVRAEAFSGATTADIQAGRIASPNGLESSRPLFGQPEWIANADISFDHPDWGTKATLSIFAISEVLDGVGAATLNVSSSNPGSASAIELDRYLDTFYQLDFTMAQSFALPRVPGEFTARASIKNLTDTTRKVIYDQAQTLDDIPERKFKIGRDYSFAIGYAISF